MKMFRLWLLLMCGMVLVVPAGAGAQQKKYTLAVVPQAQVSEVFEKWLPFVKLLSRDTGVEIDIVPYNSFPQFEADLARGVPDFVYMNPYHAMKNPSYVPMLRDKADLVGILVTHQGSGINTVQDLSGKQIAFPAPSAFAASLYMRALLTEKEKIRFTPVYAKTHGNVYRTVVLNKASAGGGVKKTLMKEQPELRDQLMIIYETPGTPSHPFAAHKKVPEDVRKRVARAVMTIAHDKANTEMLTGVQLPDPVEANYERDYAPLKKLKLEKYFSNE
ncbi:MAG: phosphate/phosphite/phosphonate ABC transporter substrate-binding protein [Nitrospirota bacterium]